MIRCSAATSYECGSNICCEYCEKRSGCDSACFGSASECDYAFDDENALAVFEQKELDTIQAMTKMLQQKKELEEQEKAVRKQLVEAMGAYGIKSFDNDLLKITYVAPTTRTSIDSKALKKDLPDIAAKYSKTSNVSASVKITLKEGK